MVTNFEYGYESNIKDKVAGKGSQQLTAYEVTKANRYASEIINSVLDRPAGFVISVNQSTTIPPGGEITSTEPYANSISAIAEKLGTQLLRYDFNEQVAKSESEWTQAMAELAEIKKSLSKLGTVTSTKTVVAGTKVTYPSNPDASFISGVRRRTVFWN
jgi:hypothetical protein